MPVNQIHDFTDFEMKEENKDDDRIEQILNSPMFGNIELDTVSKPAAESNKSELRRPSDIQQNQTVFIDTVYSSSVKLNQEYVLEQLDQVEEGAQNHDWNVSFSDKKPFVTFNEPVAQPLPQAFKFPNSMRPQLVLHPGRQSLIQQQFFSSLGKPKPEQQMPHLEPFSKLTLINTVLNLQLQKFPSLETEKMAELCHSLIKSTLTIAISIGFALSRLDQTLINKKQDEREIELESQQLQTKLERTNKQIEELQK